MVLAAAAPAAAAPIVLGPGHKPGVAVDPAGTAYVAWGSHTNPALNFCRLPRGAPDCAARSTLPVVGDSLSRPFVRVSGSVVDVVQYRYGLGEPAFDAVQLWNSTDGGLTWSAPRAIGTVPFYDAVAGPGDALSFATDAVTEGQLYQRAPMDGSAQVTTKANLSPERPHQGSVAIVDGVPLVVTTGGDSSMLARRFGGSGDPNDAANWLAAVELGKGRYMRLASGPTGVFMWELREDGWGAVRRYAGSLFDPALPITTGPAYAHGELHQDPVGRLHAFWSQGDVDGIHLFHAVSDNGTEWRRGDLGVTTEGAIAEPRAAVAADHVGVLAWGGTAGGTAVVKLQAVGPEPPVALQPQPSPTPAPSPAPTSTPTPTPQPQPQLGKRVVLRTVSGTVLVKLPGAGRYVALSDLRDVPVGSTVDTRKGRVELTIARRGGGAEAGQFSRGLFAVRQAADGAATLKLAGGSFSRCTTRARAAARSRRKVRRLFGDGKGRFRTTGRYASATVRGTRWLTEDRCDGTLVQVSSGVVRVRDLARRRTRTVRARQRYFARAR